ncbi:acyltransferase [Lacinutrix iliipiscaria]|uniref:Acyltransferase n=1 Tax=Lacinutrix iliipiscaria TaxID=1230532 RepID=A0ABW5WN15_9FLAO
MKIIIKIFFFFKKLLYSNFSNNNNTEGTFQSHQPVVVRGKGKIRFGKQVSFGVINSPHFYNSYAYIEARTPDSYIEFGENININNSFSVISEKKIVVGNNVLIGFNCTITDSNFHDLNPKNRAATDPNPEDVVIEENVFIGNNVTILKGVTIGKNTVVAASSVVTKSFPENVVIAGIPAKVIQQLA